MARMFYSSVALFLIGLISVAILPRMENLAASRNQPYFHVLIQDIADGQPPSPVVFQMDFPKSTNPQPDEDMFWTLDENSQPQYGQWWFADAPDADRIGYHSCWTHLMHVHPIGGPPAKAVRFSWTLLQPGNHRLNDKYMGEYSPNSGLGVQAMPQYPYEGSAINLDINRTRPGGVIEVYHQNEQHATRPYEGAQLIASFDFADPAFMPVNELIWYYQGNGIWVGEDSVYGPLVKLVVSTTHPRYAIINSLVDSNGGFRHREWNWQPYDPNGE